MVSQRKDKRRSQEGTPVLKDLELVMAQKELASQLQALTTKKSVAPAAKKLLKTAQHDGLNDIGEKARLTALEIFYTANRPSDMVEVLKGLPTTGSSSSTAEDVIWSQYGLLAHSMLQDWTSAVQHAEVLFCNQGENTDNADASLPVAQISPEAQVKCRGSAILAFANTDRHLSIAEQLLDQEIKDGTNASVEIGAILRSHVRTGSLQKAKSLFQKLPASLLDKESYDLALECAARDGDIELMEQALGDTYDMAALQKELEAASNKRPNPIMAVRLTRILETLDKAAASDGHLSNDHQTLAVQAIKVLWKSSKSKNLPPISNILMALDKDSDLEAILQARKDASYVSSLTTPAKVRILPTQYAVEQKTNNTGDAWKILTSLLTSNNKKDCTISQEGRIVLRNQQSRSFSKAALNIALQENNLEIAQAILQECWELILTDEDNTVDWIAVLTVMETIPSLPARSAKVTFSRPEENITYSLPDRSESIALFDKISRLLKDSVGSDGVAEERPSLTNEKLELIVRATICSLRAMASSVSNDDDKQNELLTQCAIEVSEAAMKLLIGLEEFSPEYYWTFGDSDNGAKEALQTIMKELLLSKLLPQDDDLIRPACRFYHSLASVAQSSSVIGYIEILFPSTAGVMVAKGGSLILDPFKDFRDLVLGKKKGGNLFASAVASLLLEGEKGDLEMLLQAVACMTILSDQRTGGRSREDFVLEYKNALVNERKDLFLDLELLPTLCIELCKAATTRKNVMGATKKEVPLEASPVEYLLSPDVAEVMVKNLGLARDAKYWIVKCMEENKQDVDFMVQVSVRFLVNLYTQIEYVEELMDLENKPLLEAYTDACGQNTAVLVRACTGTSLGTSKKPKGLGRQRKSTKRRKKLSGDMTRWKSVLQGMLKQFSELAARSDYDFIIKGGIVMVEHALNTFSNCAPGDDSLYEEFDSVLSPLLADKTLDPGFREALSVWYNKHMKGDQDEDDGSQ